MKAVIIRVPSAVTLKKYGLTAQTWMDLLKSQGCLCAICKKVPKTGRFCTDHFHVKGWKKMKPEKRRKYVRGLTCWWCNKTYLGRAINVAKAESVLAYLRAFEAKAGAYAGINPGRPLEFMTKRDPDGVP